jgi:thiamine pyrophosphate-dependent acetolactate synthase large subunit-like protein
MRVHAAIARALSDHGVGTMFGVIGDANLYLVDSFVRDRGGRFVSAANEAGAVLMAIGYAQVSDRVGVATVTHGPALTNTLTALIEGVRLNIPLVLVAGDTPLEARNHLQKAPQRELVTAAGVGFEHVRAPATLLQDIATAFRRAVVERRPVVLNIPANFQWDDIPYARTVHPLPDQRTVGPSSAALDDAIGIIAAARRPIVLAGRGVHTPESRAAVSRLARRIEAALATTLRARGMFGDDPFCIGVFGMMSSPAASAVIADSDCVVAFGASLNDFTTYNGDLVRGKRVVQVIRDAAAIGFWRQPDAGVVGDPGLTADLVVEWLDEAEIPGSGFRSDDLARTVADRRLDPVAARGRPGTVALREVLSALDAAIPRDRVFALDTGRFMVEGLRHFDVTDPSSFVFTTGFGSIGFGMGEAIGAAEAAPGRPVVMLCGDGGFMLGGLAEFNTAVRHRCDLIVIVCNDGSYGAEHIQFADKGMDPALSLFDWPGFAGVATALGGRGVTVGSSADIPAAVAAIAARSGPLLIDVKLDPDIVPRLG